MWKSVEAWTSLDKEESLACQITSPINNKLGGFKIKLKILPYKNDLSLY